MIPLIDIGVREVEDDRTRQFCFELFPLVGEKMKSSKPIANEAGKMTDSTNLLFLKKNKLISEYFRLSYCLSNVSNNRR